MSDQSQSIVDLDATAKKAPKLSRLVMEHLFEKQIASRKPSNCVLGPPAGHSPGSKWSDACEGKPKSSFLARKSNGVAVCVERSVFDAGANGIDVVCPKCLTHVDEMSDEWTEAVGSWFEGNERAAWTCPKCLRSARLNDWNGPFPWAFGNLGFTFWNWPPLSPEFVSDIGRVLGHRVKLVRQHL